MPNKVFISYRREDSRYQARRIYDAFVHALPPDTVFMDVDSIPPGADFVEILEGWVQQCDVLLALIGPNWLNSIDPRTGLRRVDSPDDFVRIEVRGALERKIPVVPVLLDATEMPTAAELPDDIKALRRRHAEFVDFRTFDADVQRLIKRLKLDKKAAMWGETQGAPAPDNRPNPVLAAAGSLLDWIKWRARASQPLLRAAGLASLLLAAGVAVYVMPGPDASARLADLAKSEEGRRTAETRAKEAADALAIAEKARQEFEAKASALAAALDKTEESRRAAEARASDTAEALKKSEKARQEAETRANNAVAAQAKAEEAQRTAEKARAAAEGAASGAAIARTQADNSRQFAEASASDAADALKKSEKARQEAETRAKNAVAAQAKAEEAQGTAEKARTAAEGAASIATTAKNLAEFNRQFAEVRANDAAEALKKSEKARQEAEAKLAALTKAEESRKIADARASPAPSLSSSHLLADVGKSRWVMSAEGSCWATKNVNFLSPEVGDGTITWVNGLGNRTTEKIQISFENSFYTDTRSYTRSGDKILVTPKGGSAFLLERCPVRG